jgi:hypothetical protein
MAIGRTDSWLGRFHRRKQVHLSAPKAITATARKTGLRHLPPHEVSGGLRPLGVVVYELKAKQHRMRRLRREAEEIGFEMVASQKVA